jgi:chemotaxis protein methyltransferase CheR
MKDSDCVVFLQSVLPRLRMRWPGFRKVRRQVCKRVDRRLRELGLADAHAYRDYLETHANEWSLLDEFCRIPISRFYRDRGVFDLLRERVLPQLAENIGAGELRCWSAGCASGEEPYTLTIIWRLALAKRFPNVALGIVASDVQLGMLDRARRACYKASSLKDLPQPWRPLAFDETEDGFRLKPQFRENVKFRRQDIRESMPDGPFHLILCRHLAFTYFDAELQRRMLDRFTDRLTPGGILVGGKQETLPSLPPSLAEARPNFGVYRKSDAASDDREGTLGRDL